MSGKTTNPLTFGFDIGIASVGWCVLGEDHIVGLGARCFDPSEDEKGEPHNQKRRAARVARNRLHMRRWRLRQLLRLFCDAGIISKADPQLLVTPPRTKHEPEMGPWQLRAQGLGRPLEPIEWARVLYHLVKHRGFEFFRKSEINSRSDGAATGGNGDNGQSASAAPSEESNVDTDKQKLTKALGDSSKRLGKYRKLLGKPDLTVGTLAIWLAQKDYAPGEPRPDKDDCIESNTFHNKSGSYRHAFVRAALRHELQELFKAQIEHQNQYTTQELPDDGQYLQQMLAAYGASGIPVGGESRRVGKTFQEAVFDLFDLQHPPLYEEQIREMVGECELIKGKQRASKNAFSAERATWLEKLNHLKIRRNGKENFLTAEERACLLNLPYEHRVVTLKLIRETLMAHTGFPASWKEASFNVTSYQSKPVSDGAWIFIASNGREPLSLTKWADNKERKEKLKKAKESLTSGVITFQQLRQQLGLADSDRFTCKLKETTIIPKAEEATERIRFSVQGDGILASGQSFRYIPTIGKAKVLPKVAWKQLSSLQKHSSATLADWRTMLTSLKEMSGIWQFEHSVQTESTVEFEAEVQTPVPLQFEDAQTVEADHKLVEFKGWHTLRLALAERSPERWAQMQVAYSQPLSDEGKRAAESIDGIATVLAVCQTDQEIEKELSDLGYSEAEIEALQSISFNKFRNLSFAALHKILPYLEEGHVYSEACKQAGLSHSEKRTEKRTPWLPPLETYIYQRYRHGKLTGHVESRYKELRNPVVARSFNQARLVFNALIAKHGSPAYVHVETARDLARSKKLRDKISFEQNANRKRTESLRASLRDKLGHDPNSIQLLKMRLYGEQGSQCIYTGTSLEPHIDSILHNEEFVEIDHIWPRSKTFDNSLDNRALVIAGANHDKGNRIPYEFLNGAGGDPRWREFEKRVLACKGMSAEKQRRLLSKSLEDADEFLARNLVDTRYATRMFANMLREKIEFAGGATPDELEAISPDDDGTTRWNRYQRARVRSPQGRLVDFLRGKWGLDRAKDRENSDLHHALDACIIAACTPQVIQRVNNYFAQEENEPNSHRFKRNTDGTYTCRTTGEIINKSEARERGLYLPAPWDSFHRDVLNALDRVFISRRPKRKSAGELHDANPKGIRYLPVPLVDLTEDMLAEDRLREITGRRRKNYEILRKVLRLADGDAQVAFANGCEIQGAGGKPKLVHGIALPAWSSPDGYLKQKKSALAKTNKERRMEGSGKIIENTVSARKTVQLTSLKKKKLTEAALGSVFYRRNEELLEALNNQLNKFGDDAKKAFAEPFRPPKGKSGKERPLIRSIRLPVTQDSGMLVRGGIAGLGASIYTEVYRTESGFFFRPRYAAAEESMFGLEELPTGAKHQFNLRIDDPIEVVLTSGEVIPGGDFPGYFVMYEGDGRMKIRTHDRPGKAPRKTNQTEENAESNDNEQSERVETDTVKDTSLHRFRTKDIQELYKFKVDILGNFKKVGDSS
ncbi:MAG: type II CRISPR RNA-guided endonuclease Cas9 [Burkholderiales bacterium]|jgi:CRISPR/Cas system Type II protein with McrA/HNH and RuvC-like nuclease domain|nr:type II CRISPR RNA-guided endonuclease Cas9 [Burkholderiales bacterium]